MPFEQFTPRRFTSGNIQAYAPARAGVYGISNASEWIYISETEDIQGALLAHLQDFGALLMQRRPTGFVFEVCDGTSRSARQDRLVLEYAPTCNGHSRRRI